MKKSLPIQQRIMIDSPSKPQKTSLFFIDTLHVQLLIINICNFTQRLARMQFCYC